MAALALRAVAARFGGGTPSPIFRPSWRLSQTTDTWVEIPAVAALSTLSPNLNPALNPNYPDGFPEYMSAGATSFASWRTAWCAPCYDRVNGRILYPKQGGHADYAGNDYVRAFLRRNSLLWERVRNSSGVGDGVITNDQARLVSGSGNTCVLPSGLQAPLIFGGIRDEASAVDDAYNGMSLFVFGQVEQTITDYVGATRTATVFPGFSGSVANALYSIADGPMVQGLLGEASGRYSDGRARATHTYNQPCYAELDNAVWLPTGGGGFSWTASQAVYNAVRIDAETGDHLFYDAPSTEVSASPFGAASAYDPTRGAKGSIWYIGQGAGRIGRLDCATGTWAQSGTFSVRGGEQCMCYLPGYDMLLLGSSAGVWAIYDCALDTYTNIGSSVSGTPAGGVTSYGSGQLLHVPADNNVYWWNNESGSTTLINKMAVPAAPKTDAWSMGQTTPHASNAVTPSARQPNGTYTGFMYDPLLDCFLLQNDVSGPVYSYARGSL